MINAVSYCRVSSEEQALKDLSIPAQKKALRRWMEERPDHALMQGFVDEGESAYAPAHKRPGFCEMVSFCRRNDVNLILVHKLDRFSRNREESILFKSLLRKHGVTVKSITENYNPETPQGFLYEGMIEVINQFYSMNLATETVKGMRENAERGYCNGGRVPYGYRLERVIEGGGREHSRLAPGPEEEVAVLRRIFDMAAVQGMGGKRIANTLNGEAVRAPRSQHWNASTINNILDNRAYVGDRVWLKRRKAGQDGTRVTNPEAEQIIVENAHEPLVDRGLFERRRELASKRAFHRRGSKEKHVEYLLSRLIRCDRCGSNFAGRRRKYKNRKGETYDLLRYYCGGYLNKGPSVCPSFPIHKDWIEGLVLDLLRARLCSPDALAELESRVQERIEDRRRTYGKGPKAIQQRIHDIERRIDNYYKAIGDGLDNEVCRQHIEELTADKTTLEEEARLLTREDYYSRALQLNIDELRRFAKAFDEGFEEAPFGVRRQLVLHFIDEIVVVDHKLLRIHFKIPFDNNGVKLLADQFTGKTPEGSDSGNAGNAHGAGDSETFLSGPIRGANHYLIAHHWLTVMRLFFFWSRRPHLHLRRLGGRRARRA